MLKQRDEESQYLFMKGVLQELKRRGAKAYLLGKELGRGVSSKPKCYVVAKGKLGVVVPIDDCFPLYHEVFQRLDFPVVRDYDSIVKMFTELHVECKTPQFDRDLVVENVFAKSEEMKKSFNVYMDYQERNKYYPPDVTIRNMAGVITLYTPCNLSNLQEALGTKQGITLSMRIVDAVTCNLVMVVGQRNYLYALRYNKKIEGYRLYHGSLVHDISIEDYKALGLPKPDAFKLYGTLDLYDYKGVLATEGEIYAEKLVSASLQSEVWLQLLNNL